MRLFLILSALLESAAQAQNPVTITYATGGSKVAITASWTAFGAVMCNGTVAYDLWYATSFAGPYKQMTQPALAGPLSTSIPVGVDPTFWIVRQHCIGQGYLGSTNVTQLCLSGAC